MDFFFIEWKTTIWNLLKFSVKLILFYFFLTPNTRYLSVYEDLGWWRGVASDCRIICEFHFRSPRRDLFIVFTGTNSPMWFILICVNDTYFFIISPLFSSFYFLHATSAASGAGLHIFLFSFWEVLRDLIQEWSVITVYSCTSTATFTCDFVPVFCFAVTQRFRWNFENKQCIWHCNSYQTQCTTMRHSLGDMS